MASAWLFRTEKVFWLEAQQHPVSGHYREPVVV
jgi:hypothetical protein